MKKFMLAWLVVFLSVSVFSAIDSNIKDTILDEATIKTTTFNFLNPYVTRIKPEQVTQEKELTGGYDSIDKMLVYGVLGKERDLSNYIIFEVEFDDSRGIKKSTLLKNNIFIEGVPVENFELIYMVVTASGYFGTYGCRGDGDAKLYLIGYVENLQSILNNNETITMEIKSEKEEIEFHLTDKLSKLIDFANLY